MCNEILKVKDLVVQRGSFVLDEINFSLYNQEMMAVIGKTGSGKTLLLETIAGFNKPRSGNIWYLEQPMHRIPIHQRGIGYLFQDYSLFPHMTVEENIGYSLKVKGLAKRDIRIQVDEIAERFEISHILKQYPGTLSGGEQQRTALARVLMMRPKLLLLDEPFSALDPATKNGMYQLMREIRSDFGCSILFVTHDFSEARQLADRVGILVKGTLRGVVASNALFSAEWDDEVRSFLGLK